MYGAFIEMIPVEYLDSLNNPNPKEKTDLLDHTTRVNLEDLWLNIIQKLGIRDPILLHATPHGTARVEAGNQRVEISKRKEETFLPAICHVSFEHLLHPGNGTHVFDLKNEILIKEDVLKYNSEIILPPSAVFKTLQTLKNKNKLPDFNQTTVNPLLLSGGYKVG